MSSFYFRVFWFSLDIFSWHTCYWFGWWSQIKNLVDIDCYLNLLPMWHSPSWHPLIFLIGILKWHSRHTNFPGRILFIWRTVQFFVCLCTAPVYLNLVGSTLARYLKWTRVSRVDCYLKLIFPFLWWHIYSWHLWLSFLL